jgi:predicted deacylase
MVVFEIAIRFEPGDEPNWTAALPLEDRAFMQSIAK